MYQLQECADGICRIFKNKPRIFEIRWKSIYILQKSGIKYSLLLELCSSMRSYLLCSIFFIIISLYNIFILFVQSAEGSISIYNNLKFVYQRQNICGLWDYVTNVYLHNCIYQFFLWKTTNIRFYKLLKSKKISGL